MPQSPAAVEIDAQYRLLREGAGVLERDRGSLTVSGPDAADFLQGQVTNEVESLSPGEGCYAALLDRKGHLQADLRLLRVADDELWLDTEPEACGALLRHLATYKVGREVEVADARGERVVLSVIGPGAARAAGVEAPGPEHSHRAVHAGGAACRAVVTDLGLDLLLAPADSATALAALREAGAEPVGEAAAEILRVESGRPRFGPDMGPETMPAEAGIVERAVSFEKGCYIGQEPVARLHYRGRPNRTLRGLRLEAAAARGEPLRLGDREVGELGTVCLSPALGPIALAVVRREAGIGDLLAVGEAGTGARLVELPFDGGAIG